MWAVSLAGLFASYALRAERLKREWGSWFTAQRQPERAPGFVPCLALFLTHNAAIVVLPMRAGEAGYVGGQEDMLIDIALQLAQERDLGAVGAR